MRLKIWKKLLPSPKEFERKFGTAECSAVLTEAPNLNYEYVPSNEQTELLGIYLTLAFVTQ